jgi:hypothetical protein
MVQAQRPSSAMRSLLGRTGGAASPHSSATSTRPASTTGTRRLVGKVDVQSLVKVTDGEERVSQRDNAPVDLGPAGSNDKGPSGTPNNDLRGATSSSSEWDTLSGTSSSSVRRPSMAGAVRISQHLPSSGATVSLDRSDVESATNKSVSARSMPANEVKASAGSSAPVRASVSSRDVLQNTLGGAVRVNKGDNDVLARPQSSQVKLPANGSTMAAGLTLVTRPSSGKSPLTIPAASAPSNGTVPGLVNALQFSGSSPSDLSEDSPTTTASERSTRPSADIDDKKGPGVVIYTPETLRKMVQDDNWETRLKAFEVINHRLKQAESSDQFNDTFLDIVLDLSVTHLEDSHIKIASESMQVIQRIIENVSYSLKTRSKIPLLITALFFRLADRRLTIRDQANALLNTIRQSFDPVLIITALSPKMVEMPSRIRTAVVQFLGAIVPRCEEFFTQSGNTSSFLGRLATLLSDVGGTKPSATLTIAGKRLLDLVHKTAPKVMSFSLGFIAFHS